MPVSYLPVPLEARQGNFVTMGLVIEDLLENGTFDPMDLTDFTSLTWTCGSVSLTIQSDEGLPGLTLQDGQEGEIDVRLSSANLATFTLTTGLPYTSFNWKLTGVQTGDSAASLIADGELRVYP